MNNIKVECKIKVYNDNNFTKNKIEEILIKSHWSKKEIVKIIIDDKQVEVSGQELITAIQNCMNAC
jgi:hypothetical protein